MNINAYHGGAFLNMNKPIIAPQYDPVRREHYWLMLVGFHVADPDAADNVLDNENLIHVTLECFFCDLPYAPMIRLTRCPGPQS
jgi:hypothetical protein